MVGICHFKYARIARNQAAQDVLCIYWWAINKYKHSARVLLSTRLGSILARHTDNVKLPSTRTSQYISLREFLTPKPMPCELDRPVTGSLKDNVENLSLVSCGRKRLGDQLFDRTLASVCTIVGPSVSAIDIGARLHRTCETSSHCMQVPIYDHT